MNKTLTQLEATCYDIIAKIKTERSWQNSTDDKSLEADTVEQCADLLIKFMKDAGFKMNIEIAEDVPTLQRRMVSETH